MSNLLIQENYVGSPEQLIVEGYIEEDGTPIKCYHCEHTEFEIKDKCHIEGLLCEYGVYCKKCGKLTAYWAYGNWAV